MNWDLDEPETAAPITHHLLRDLHNGCEILALEMSFLRCQFAA